MYVGLRVKYPLFLTGFSETLNFFDRFSKNAQISNLMKIRPVGGPYCCMWTEGRTDRPTNMTKLIDALRNFAVAPSDILNFLKCPFLQTLYLCLNLSLNVG